MNIDWQNILTGIGIITGGGVAVLGFAVWMLKKVVTHMLDKDTERFKDELKTKADSAIESLKSSMPVSLRQNARVSSL